MTLIQIQNQNLEVQIHFSCLHWTFDVSKLYFKVIKLENYSLAIKYNIQANIQNALLEKNWISGFNKHVLPQKPHYELFSWIVTTLPKCFGPRR